MANRLAGIGDIEEALAAAARLRSAWLLLPLAGAGALDFELFLRSTDLNRRGVWRWCLGAVLTSIARASLPGMLASLDYATQGAEGFQLPPSECLSASVNRGKLVLDGRVRFLTESGPLVTDYTMRTGVSPQSLSADSSLPLYTPDGSPLSGGSSMLLWDSPEIRLSLGEKGLVGMLPKLWVPVLSSTGLRLPPRVDLRRASVSDASDGLVVAGRLLLECVLFYTVEV